MKAQRNNPNGGRELQDNHFPLHEDRQGNFGYLIGYIDKNITPGDKIVVPVGLATQFAEHLGFSIANFREIISTGYRPRKKLKVRLVEMLGGTVDK